ncbi:MAG: hypothetical protein ACOWWM_01135 [Desulfobacterales bacterium]
MNGCQDSLQHEDKAPFRLERKPDGRMVLTVWYDSEARDWDQRIRRALEAVNMDRRQVLVIASPRGLKL